MCVPLRMPSMLFSSLSSLPVPRPLRFGVFAVVISAWSASAQPRLQSAAGRLLPDSFFQKLTFPTTLAFGYPANDVHTPYIVGLLKSHRFDELETLIASLRQAVASDARHELRLATVYDALDRDDSVLLASINSI